MKNAEADAGVVAALDTNSEAWRHECEARGILALPTLSARRRRLTMIEARRGASVREQLDLTIGSIMERRIAAGKVALEQIKSLIKGTT